MSIAQLKLSWRNLSLEDSKAKATILNGLNGEIETGRFLSIMGPSGAGKSSLLSILSCRLRKDNTKLIISGDVHLNGDKYGLNDFSKLSAYVQQDDVLFGTLTVKQTFQFHSRLKLWRNSETEQSQKTESLLKKLNLMDCADALVGSNQFKKGISGGQKKRVAIGVQLISNPHILIFDEPTSGLDSHNALVIMRLLGKLAKQQKKLVIATIHQPSTLIFREMDQLLLLKKGQCIYKGSANNIVPYMQKLGIRVDYRMNPADFFMMEISQFKQQNGFRTTLNSQNCKILLQSGDQPLNESYDRSALQNMDLRSEQPAIRNQFHALFSRSFKAFARSPLNQLNKLVTAILIPGILGLLFKNIGNQVPDTYDQTYVFKLISLLFMVNFFVFSMNVYDTTLIFPNQKEIVCKEAGSNLYSLPIYFVARMMTQILGCVVPAIICSTIIYAACGLDFSGYHFPIFMGVLVSMGLCGYLFGLFFGVLNKDSVQAINILPLVVIPMMIYGGLVVKLDTIPQYSRWLQYLSPIRHSFTIIFQDQLNSNKMAPFQPFNLPHALGLDGDPGFAFLYIMALSVFFIACSIVILMALKMRL